MKVIDVAEFYAEQGGGVKTYINQKLEAGSRLGHEVVVIAPGPEDREEERLGGRIVWVKGPPLPPDPRYYVLYREKAVHAILDAERPDVVEGSSPWSGGWFAARWKGPAVKTFIFHQDPVAVYPQTFLGNALGTDNVDRLFGWYWAYLRRLSGHFDATVVSGLWLAEKLKRFRLQRPEPVPFGIDKAQFSPKRRSDAIKRSLLERAGVSSEASLLICVSRFHPEKRLPTLLKGFEIARRSKDMALVIYGDGPLRKRVNALADKIPGVVVAGFTKDRDELADVMASGDAFLHGSAAETYGLVVAEALCSGLPVVVPDMGGAADLAGAAHSEVYTTGDADDCARAILRMVARDRTLLSEGCASIATHKIGTMGTHFEQLFDLYGSMVNEKAAG